MLNLSGNGNFEKAPYYSNSIMSKWPLPKKILYSIIASFLVLLAIEAVFRIIFWINNKDYKTTVFIQGNTIQKDDSLLIFRNRPFYLDQQHRFQYNEEGMKSVPGDVLIPEKKSNDFWVLLLGASTMEGMGSNNDGVWLDITGTTDHPYYETIAWYLQQQLQEKMPDRKVRVFNAANSSYTIEQSRIRCEMLLKKIHPDWVISLDGQNNPPTLADTSSVLSIVKKDWEMNPTKSFPLSWIIPLTSHSAFVNSMKQYVFHRKTEGRLETAASNNYPERRKWLQVGPAAIKADTVSKGVSNAVETYYKEWLQFDSALTQKQQKHLLLLQPHILFRNTSLLDSTEKALYSYYSTEWNDEQKNGFLIKLRDEFKGKTIGHSSMAILNEVDTLHQQVFVDYCHFTQKTNRFVATVLLNYILKEQP
ncbi:MAG: hypothetical protein IPP79_21765 [Chitinophagaceae bacterium]|nr:hypothetical protein [Chitinophagaceae bacterium]